MLTEGSQGILPELHENFKYNKNGHVTTLPSNTGKFRSWITQFVAEQKPIKETNLISNYAATNMLPQHVGDESIIHGATMYAPWNASKEVSATRREG